MNWQQIRLQKYKKEMKMDLIKCVSTILITMGLLLLLSTVLLYGQAEGQEKSPPKTIEWKNYNSTASGLSIDYPSTWNIQDKQNRFEETCSNCSEGTDLEINSYVNDSGIVRLLDPDFISFSVLAIPEVPDRNITTLTTTIMDNYLEPDSDSDFERRLIEGVNTSRYKIGGENAGSFITVDEEKDSDFKGALEDVVTVHNNQIYTFMFHAPAEVFDTQRVTEIRKHMFDSIKWLN